MFYLVKPMHVQLRRVGNVRQQEDQPPVQKRNDQNRQELGRNSEFHDGFKRMEVCQVKRFAGYQKSAPKVWRAKALLPKPVYHGNGDLTGKVALPELQAPAKCRMFFVAQRI